MRTVLLATDDADGSVVARLKGETAFNWAFNDFPRQQFKKRGWMEFRSAREHTHPRTHAAAKSKHCACAVLCRRAHAARVFAAAARTPLATRDVRIPAAT